MSVGRQHGSGAGALLYSRRFIRRSGIILQRKEAVTSRSTNGNGLVDGGVVLDMEIGQVISGGNILVGVIWMAESDLHENSFHSPFYCSGITFRW